MKGLQFALFILIIGYAGGYENSYIDFKGFAIRAAIIGGVILGIQILIILRGNSYERNN